MTRPQHENGSLVEYVASLPEPQMTHVMAELTDEECEALEFDWRFWGRPAQFAPEGTWNTWLILTGRGWGKTRSGAEWIREQVEQHGRKRIALVARTAADIRDTMIEGESGILNICPEWSRPKYEPSKRRLTWPNGAIATAFTAEKPDLLRGPQHDAAWCDELASWKYLQETWDMLMFGLRLGDHPQVVITTTPRPLKLLREIMEDPQTVTVRGSTYENMGNLAPSFAQKLRAKYEGTRLGRQEIGGEILDDVPGALWNRRMLEECCVRKLPVQLQRIVVAIDPAVTSGENADDTGIVAAGLGTDGLCYVLADETCHESPGEWAKRAVRLYHSLEADRIIGEVNNGGDLVETTIRTVDDMVSYRAVRASRGKRARAEPVAALYEQKRVRHVGAFAELEDQMCTFMPATASGRHEFDGSPDRVDALVWALTELMIEHSTGAAPVVMSGAPYMDRGA